VNKIKLFQRNQEGKDGIFGREGMAPLILNVGTGQKTAVSFTPAGSALSINLTGGCLSPESVWLFRRRDLLFATNGNRIMIPAAQPLA
jgi:hypothetical protein